MKLTVVSILPDLILLGEDHGGLHVQPGHGVRPVLCQHHWLPWEYWSASLWSQHCTVTPGLSPVCEIVVELLLDDLGVAWVAVPGIITIECDNVKMLTGVVLQRKYSNSLCLLADNSDLIPLSIADQSHGPGGVQLAGVLSYRFEILSWNTW